MTAEVAEFRLRAESFCRLIETAESLERPEFFERVAAALGELYASAVRLPWITGSDVAPDGLRTRFGMKHGPPGRAGRLDAVSSGGPISADMGAPCVLASRRPSHPDRRVVIPKRVLSGRHRKYGPACPAANRRIPASSVGRIPLGYAASLRPWAAWFSRGQTRQYLRWRPLSRESRRLRRESRRLRERLSCRLGTAGDYWKIFDPWEREEPLLGSPADDLAGIYQDVAVGLAALERGVAEDDVVWEWRFGFWSHWSRHAVAALRALWARLASGALEPVPAGVPTASVRPGSRGP